jgi:hypothetical protein
MRLVSTNQVTLRVLRSTRNFKKRGNVENEKRPRKNKRRKRRQSVSWNGKRNAKKRQNERRNVRHVVAGQRTGRNIVVRYLPGRRRIAAV